MKTRLLLLILPFAALAAGCQSPTPTAESTARARTTAPADLINPNETLHIVVNTDGVSAVDDLSAFSYIKQAFEEVFVKEGNWQGELVFDRWPAGSEAKENQSIRIWLTEWRSRPLTEVVARFHVTVHVPDREPVELGVFLGEASTIAATENQLIEQFRTAARRAFEQLYPQVMAIAEGGNG